MSRDASHIATPSLSAAVIRAFAASFGGRVLTPDHPEFAAAAIVHQGAAAGRPALIAQPCDAADVARAIAFGREHELEIAVRGGGHSVAGHSTGNGVLVIDLRGLRELAVDPVARRVRAGAGLTAGDVVAATHEFGMTVPFGDTASVGIAGITLGGGVGFLSRRDGMTIDHLLAVELVTADGRLVRASADSESELFWGLRGGGGNFGIATAFEYGMVDAGIVYGGALLLPATWNVLRGIAPIAASAPEGLTVIANYMPAPPAPFVPPEMIGQPVVVILGAFAGDLAEGEAAWAPFRALAKPVVDVVGPIPYPALYRFTEAASAPGPTVNRSVYLETIDDSVIEAMRDAYETSPGIMTLLQIRVLGGAVARVPAGDTAIAHRQAPIALFGMTRLGSLDALPAAVAWGDALLGKLQVKSVGVYSNFLEDEGEACVREAYPARTYRRLAALKTVWDPQNVFRRNCNIRPEG
jgi:hypothetical protein